MILELTRFKKVADVGNITKASEILFITQPALTQSIHRLEKELKVKLFRMSGKKISLTREGKTIYLLADKILEIWGKALNLNTEEGRKISIGLFDSAAIKLAGYFQSKRVELVIDRSEILLKKLNYGILDISICVMPRDLRDFPNIKQLASYKEKLIPVSGRIRNEKIDKIPFILYGKDSLTGKFVDSIFTQHKIMPLIIAESVSPLYIKELALGNYGVGILPEDMVKDEIRSRKLFIQKLPITFERTCGIFKNNDTNADEIVNDIKFHLSTQVGFK